MIFILFLRMLQRKTTIIYLNYAILIRETYGIFMTGFSMRNLKLMIIV